MNKVLEFERKYVLDLSRFAEIKSILITRLGAQSVPIAQCYLDNGAGGETLRYRKIFDETVEERKDSINFGAPYSAHIERSMPVSSETFKNAWSTSKRRLSKVRYTVDRLPRRICSEEDFGPRHALVVDQFFERNSSVPVTDDPLLYSYALLAEVETIIDPTSKRIDLDFRLPLCLRPFVIWEVDRRDPRARSFASMNMCERDADRVREAIKSLK